jgi:hypothetical protein
LSAAGGEGDREVKVTVRGIRMWFWIGAFGFAASRAERRRVAAAIRRDQDARSARIGLTATRMRIEAERLEEQAWRLRAETWPATLISRATVDTAKLALRRAALVARSSWGQLRRQGRR